ncbi:hypothetical protein AB0I28_05580 [Phytomonospora sp. NPDC050363]|uniref:hypothetical protein n=1 Tax=Phytomonospora sp. NPDC050363 TaxID=3155642 RepID=UPI0034043B8A
MKLTRRLALVAATVAAIVLGSAAAAHASSDIGWVTTTGTGGKAYFDADLAGVEGWESITVCDTYSDGGAAVVTLFDDTDWALKGTFKDTVNDGSCTTYSGNYVTDEHYVSIQVCVVTSGTRSHCSQEVGGVS